MSVPKPKTLVLCWCDEGGLYALAPELLMSATLDTGVVCIPTEDGARVVGPSGSTGVFNPEQMNKAIKSLQEKKVKVMKCRECGSPAEGPICRHCFSRTVAEEEVCATCGCVVGGGCPRSGEEEQ